MVNLRIHGTTLTNIELIIFDKDGTLFELYPYFSKVARRRAENVCKFLGVDSRPLVDELVYLLGVREGFMSREGPLGVHSREWSQLLLKDFLTNKGYNVDLDVFKESYKEADQYISNPEVLANSVVSVPGAEQFLESLIGRCRCAVYSGDRTHVIKGALDLKHYSKYFSIIVGGDQVLFPKPSPWGILMILGLSQIKPQNTLMIGDAWGDYYCGLGAKCQYIVTRRSDLFDPGMELLSDSVINDFTEIEVI